MANSNYVVDANNLSNFVVRKRDGDGRLFFYNSADDKVAYVAIEHYDVGKLYDNLMIVKSCNYWLPNFLYPVNYPMGSSKFVLPVECCDDQSLNLFRGEWYFQRAKKEFDLRKSEWTTEAMYGTVEFLRFLWSIILTIDRFLNQDIRPILDQPSMFISNNGGVIFTKYEDRDRGVHDEKYEATELAAFIRLLVSNKAKHCETPRLEFKLLCDWLVNTSFGRAPGASIKDALKQVVFWSPKMRIRYVTLLQDWVENNNSIYNTSKDAFTGCGGGRNYTDWRKGMSSLNNGVLKEIVKIGNDHYHRQINLGLKPSQLRRILIGNESDTDKLHCGLTRLRDGLEHFYKNFKTLSEACYYQLGGREELQMMFQYVFPAHMVEFSKATLPYNFDAVARVEEILQFP